MIKITEKYYVDTDKYNYILLEKHTVTKSEAESSKKKNIGDIEYKQLGYYMNLEQLLTKLWEKHKRVISKDIDLPGYVEKLNRSQAKFLSEIKKAIKSWEESKNEDNI